MKLIILATLLLASCAMTPSKPALPVETPKPEVKTNLAWGDKYPEWDKALTDEIKLAKLPANTKTPCKKLSVNDCLAQLVSIMAKYESSFKPETQFKESFNDSKGKPVISRGLLQLSIESANQKAYGCNIKKAEELHNPKTNLECAVKIVVFQANKSGTLMDGNRGGASAYWSVARKSSGSNAKILKYLEAL